MPDPRFTEPVFGSVSLNTDAPCGHTIRVTRKIGAGEHPCGVFMAATEDKLLAKVEAHDCPELGSSP